jgi:CheY-like chemotaxis protein
MLAALDALSEALATPLDRSTIRDAVARWLSGAIGADAWSLVLCDEEAYAAPGLAGLVMRRNRALRTSDYAAECARHGLSPSVSDESMPPHWLGAPIGLERSILGVLSLGRRARPFTDEEQALLATAARVVALAVRAVDLVAVGERAALELSAARDDIARDRGLAALGEAAAGIVHDFNNTLAAILIHSEILTTESEKPELARHVEVIHSAALQGARTVRRLRDLSQPRRPRPFRPVELNEMLGDIVALTRVRWRDEAQARNVRYEVAVEAAPLPAVSADPVELGDALTMLVFQALGVMPGGGRIVLRTGVEGERVLCAVTAETPAPPDAGTDVMPARVAEIAQRHGGEATAVRDTRGAQTFTLWLPALAPPREPAAAAGATRRDVRVLLIDDEPAVREALREALTRLGHRVVACADGRAGLERLREESFDLVLTDLTMPDLSGWDVARQARHERPATPVVLITGWGDEVDPDEARAIGIEAVLAKPVTTRALRSIVQTVVRPPRRRRSEETG